MNSRWWESGYLLSAFIEAYWRSRGTARAAKLDWVLWVATCEVEGRDPILGTM